MDAAFLAFDGASKVTAAIILLLYIPRPTVLHTATTNS